MVSSTRTGRGNGLKARLCAAAALVAVLLPAGLARAGRITGTLEARDPIKRVWAIERSPRHLKDSKGKVHDIGMYGRPHEGKVDGVRIVVEDLPVPGTYDLNLETASGGVIAGWDATVPESDYVGDPPLEETSKQKILKKLADKQFSAFSDRMWVLDIRGNIQHAALLVMKLRMRPFVGGGYKPGEWVWRIERWHWENPEEHTWVPYQERPYYALIRERLYEKDYRAKRIAFAGHLGGIALTKEQSAANLGKIEVFSSVPGVYAVDPNGSRIRPVVLKGPDDAGKSSPSKAAASNGGKSEGG